MDYKTEKAYKISRFVLPIISFAILCIMFLNEDSSWLIVAFILSFIIFMLSFPSTWMSKKIYNLGNKFNNKILRICYYLIILPIIEFILFFLTYIILLFLGDKFIISHTTDMGEALGQGFTILFFVFVATVCIILPHIQALLVIFIKRFLKDKKQINLEVLK